MNWDIENWLKCLKKQINRKRKRTDDISIDTDEMTKELKYVAITSLEEAISTYNLSGRKLTRLLTKIQDQLTQTRHLLNINSIDDKEFSLMIIAFSSIIIELIDELKLEIYSSDLLINILLQLKI